MIWYSRYSLHRYETRRDRGVVDLVTTLFTHNLLTTSDSGRVEGQINDSESIVELTKERKRKKKFVGKIYKTWVLIIYIVSISPRRVKYLTLRLYSSVYLIYCRIGRPRTVSNWPLEGQVGGRREERRGFRKEKIRKGLRMVFEVTENERELEVRI